MSEQIKPFITVDEAVRKTAFNEWRGKPAATIESHKEPIQRDLERSFEESGPDLDLEKISSIGGSLAEKCEKLIQMHSELSGINDALQEKRELDHIANEIRDQNHGGGVPAQVETNGSGDDRTRRNSVRLSDLVRVDFQSQGLLPGSKEFADACSRGSIKSSLSLRDDRIMNALFQTTAGWPPDSLREPGYTPSLRHPIQVIDILPRSSTTQELVKFMKETTFTNAAAGVAEAGASPESTLALTEQEEAVRKISTHIPVTREDMEDEPQVDSYLNETVPFMVRQKSDELVLKGDGTAPNPRGLLNVADIQNIDWTTTGATGAKVRSKPLNIMRKAKTKIRFGGRAMATHFIMNPDVWDDVVLSESSAGGYYYGSPQNDFIERAWGLPVVLSDHLDSALASDTVNGIVGDFSPMWIQLRMRRELETEWGYINDDFIKEIMRIKSSIRWALVVKRPQAFATITGP